MFEKVQSFDRRRKKRNNLQTERCSDSLCFLLIKQSRQRKPQILKEAEKANDSFGFVSTKNNHWFSFFFFFLFFFIGKFHFLAGSNLYIFEISTYFYGEVAMTQ